MPFVYASYDTGEWYVDGRFGIGFNDYDQNRPIPLLGEVAKGSFDGEHYTLDVQFGYNFGASDAVTVTPLVGISYAHVDIDGYTETGAPLGFQVVGDQSYDYFAPSVGVRVSGNAAMEGDWTVQPRAKIGVRHDLVDDPVSLNGSLGGQTAAVKYDGYDPADTVLDLGVGFSIFSAQGVSLEADYRADLAEDYTAHNIGVRVRLEF